MRYNYNYAVLVTGLTLLTTRIADAQQPAPLSQPETVPFELAAALSAAGGFGAPPQILVGGMPGWIQNRLHVPSNARVIGSAFLGTTVVSILSIPSTSDSVLSQYKTELLKKGWSEPPPTPSYGGFRPAPFTTSATVPFRVTLCGDHQLLSATAQRRLGIATDIVVRVNAVTDGASQCSPPQLTGFRPQYPTLYNPQGASEVRYMPNQTECARVSSTQTGGTQTKLRTPLSPEALIDHYGKQLADSGWKPMQAGGNVMGRSWTKPDSTGAPMELTLLVTTLADATCRDVNIEVRSTRRP